MRHVITLVADRQTQNLNEDHLQAARHACAASGGVPSMETISLSPNWAAEFYVDGSTRDALVTALNNAQILDSIDRAVQRPEQRKKRVLVADMDSTMICIETLDTMAAKLGVGEAVADITARSMEGTLEFIESLEARVALLKGFDAQASMDAVLADVVHTPGAARAVTTMRENGCICALVSGGFTFTTAVVHAELGFHHHLANTLDIDDHGKFTGGLINRLVGRETKLEILTELSAKQGVGLDQAAAIGDGANDLDMIKAAGLGIGFQPKPIVRENARFVIDQADMTPLLFFQGYAESDFVEAT